jgi:hypothetical protein
MAGAAKSTTDHDTIRTWVEERGGWPACVKATGGNDDPGLFRIDFPGYSSEDSLEKQDGTTPLKNSSRRTWRSCIRKRSKAKEPLFQADRPRIRVAAALPHRAGHHRAGVRRAGGSQILAKTALHRYCGDRPCTNNKKTLYKQHQEVFTPWPRQTKILWMNGL